MSQNDQMRGKKILWVFSSFGIDAAARRFAMLINGLDSAQEAERTEHVLLALDDEYAATRLLKPGGNWRLLETGDAVRKRIGAGGFMLGKLWSSRRILAAERPDLLVTSGLGATEWLAINRGALTAAHIHFQDPIGAEEELEGGDSRGDWGRRRAFPGRNRLFIVSDEETKAALTQRWGAPTEAIRELPWGADLNLIRPHQRQEDVVVFGSLTPLVAGKRHDRLLRILASLLERGRKASVRLAGRGAERRKLETLAQSMEIENQVEFVDRDGLDPRVAWEETAKMDVFVDLSETSRIAAGATLAMAAGLPILGSDKCAAARLAPPENGLFLRPVRDESALTAAAELLAADQDLRRGVGAANRAAAEDRFGLDAMLRQFRGLMQQLTQADPLALPAPSGVSRPEDETVRVGAAVGAAAAKQDAKKRSRNGQRGRSASA